MSNLKTTILHQADILLSGKYKIVVDKNNVLYLDDYCGNRVKIDLNQNFLPQVSNFLQNKTQIVDKKVLNYDIVIEQNLLKVHIPMYLYDEKPDYVFVGEVFNTVDWQILNKQKILYIKKISDTLNKIFDEILSNNFKHLFYNNFDKTHLIFNGYSLENNCYTELKVDTSEFQAKITNIEEYNHYIKKLFNFNNLIVPNFINIEFEFEFNSDTFDYRKLYGTFLYGEKIKSNNVSNNDFIYDTYNKVKILPQVFSQIEKSFFKEYSYETDVNTPSDYHILLKFNNFLLGDAIYFLHHTFKFTELGDSLSETLIKLRDQINDDSIFYVEKINENTLKISSVDEFQLVNIPHYVEVLNEPTIIDIFDTDVKIDIDTDIENVFCEIDGIKYDCIYKYRIENDYFYRINTNIKDKDFKILVKTDIIYEKLYEVEFSNYDILIKYFENSNKKSYIDLLFERTKPALWNNIKKFNNTKHQYIEPKPFIDTDEINSENTLSYKSGITTYIYDNIFNIDKKFYVENEKKLKFHWFLINAEPMKYLSELAQQRYVKKYTTLAGTQIKTQLKRKDKYSDYVEGIFLGVNYRLKKEFEDYYFAVIHNPNAKPTDNLYQFIVNDDRKEVILVINKLLLFIDLIRNGDFSNQPLIDLSLYYDVDDIYTDDVQYLQSIKKNVGLLLADNEKTVTLNDISFDDDEDNWYKYIPTMGTNVICIKNNDFINTSINWQNVLKLHQDFEFTNKAGTIKFKIINPIEIHKDYFWCENITAQFFNNHLLVINENFVDEPHWIEYDMTQEPINTIDDEIELQTGHIVINPNKIFDFKASYFEVKMEDDDVLKFAENPKTAQEILQIVDNNNNFDYLDKRIGGKITLFDRNQLWYVIYNELFLNIEIYYKSYAEIRKSMEDLELRKLKLYTENNEIDGIYLKIVDKHSGLVQWQPNKIYQIKRNGGLFFPRFNNLQNKYFEKITYNDDIILSLSNVIEIDLIQHLIDQYSLTYEYAIKLYTKYYRLDSVTINDLKVDFEYSTNKKYTIKLYPTDDDLKDIKVIFKHI